VVSRLPKVIDLMKRLFDIVLAVWLLAFFSIPLGIIAALLCLGSKGQALHWSVRIGKDNTIFKMPKFRTMRQGTPAVATHLLSNPENFITPIGKLGLESSAWMNCRNSLASSRAT